MRNEYEFRLLVAAENLEAALKLLTDCYDYDDGVASEIIGLRHRIESLIERETQYAYESSK